MDETQQDFKARCYCGDVRWRVARQAEVVFSGYCHCDDCRRSHATSLYQYVYVDAKDFHVERGQEQIRAFTTVKDGSFKRHFCQRCGTRVYNTLQVPHNGHQMELRGIFPSLMESIQDAKDPRWTPRKHTCAKESILDLNTIHDGLPRELT